MLKTPSKFPSKFYHYTYRDHSVVILELGSDEYNPITRMVSERLAKENANYILVRIHQKLAF